MESEDILAQALGTVGNVLDYGRQLHGLGRGGDGDSEGSNNPKLAGAIPTSPGTQSESGLPKERPFPRLEPTQNPFGKRTADNSDNSQGAIPEPDEDTETA